MAYVPSVSQIKSGRTDALPDAPKEGTRLRRIYDLLQTNKGRAVRFDCQQYGYRLSRDVGADKEILQSRWGLDIRDGGRGSLPGEPPSARGGIWLLAGEWFGKVYIDYTQNPLL